jgi:light-regulated signal transduction histidine kinase (bacteriophytochrome)
VHVSGGLIVVEAEGMPTAHTGPMSTRGLVNCAIGALRQARTLDELSRTTARVIRALSGFERVLVYRFDPDWNGETIAEDRMAAWAQSFLGLRSPASDIPAQARDLYTRNLIRFVPDHDYAPAPLLSTPDRREVPLDLSGARLRSVCRGDRDRRQDGASLVSGKGQKSRHSYGFRPVTASWPMCSLGHERRFFVPCFSTSHSPAPPSFSP